ncbi:UNVERIFIED_ORG: hypothetical protein BDK47_1812 [Anoxybacillus amylolyticus]|uniref:Uncharacterized protein n=1 Tax=Geobacillus proteiniphilus TaxID=860353 RepID=A0A1Q5SLH4_9BACL|nr:MULTISPECIES: hypothetical protein [Geobacillus]OKO88695.1 hypothetical protein BRO54_3561 [Geobacillus proteiniphilus]OPX01093.1 hypothetical protein B1A75_16840 [Geobacillus sp. LEMMY01]WMJ15156.1 hypothetical protein RA955_09875 [Geobacillus proteiniphilus]
MKKWMVALSISIAYLLICFAAVQVNRVFADDGREHFYEHGEQYEEPREKGEGMAKESGEMLGWGAVSVALLAGALLPLRRNAKFIMRTVPNIKSFFVSLLKWLATWHMPIGAAALALAIAHGALMYFSEGELEIREYMGIMAIVFAGVAAVFGAVLSKNKASSLIRSTHIGLLLAAGILVAIHILS